MDSIKEISSHQNVLIKELLELKKKSSKRKLSNLCVVEGQIEIEIALNSDLDLRSLLIRKSQYDKNHFSKIQNDKKIYCSDSIIEKLSLREHTNNFIAVFYTKTREIESLNLSDNPLVLILEYIEKPGNIGAILRTCDAVGVDAVLFTELKTDIYNPHIIRNSLGCVFSQNIVSCSNTKALKFCKTNNLDIHVTYLESGQSVFRQNFNRPTALVFGNEHTGVSEFWLQENTIKIPMNGKIDSMNISNSVAILAYEVFRQRLV